MLTRKVLERIEHSICVSLIISFKLTTTVEGSSSQIHFEAMEGQQTSVKHVLRKFLFSKNSVTIRPSYKILSFGKDDGGNSTQEEIENRGIEHQNFKSPVKSCTGCIRNSLFEKNVSSTQSNRVADVKTMVHNTSMEDENMNTQRFNIPIVILTDFSKKYVESRRLI